MSDQLLPLDYAKQPNPPRRPTLADDAVRRAAAESIMPEIIGWLGRDWSEKDREDYIEDLMDVCHEWDGYAAARKLENRSGWDPDQDLVEILGGGWGSSALYPAIAAWVEANGVVPTLAIGDTVTTGRRDRGIGEIVAIDLTHATYTVATEEFLREYPDQAGKKGGNVVPFEQCVAVARGEGGKTT